MEVGGYGRPEEASNVEGKTELEGISDAELEDLPDVEDARLVNWLAEDGEPFEVTSEVVAADDKNMPPAALGFVETEEVVKGPDNDSTDVEMTLLEGKTAVEEVIRLSEEND